MASANRFSLLKETVRNHPVIVATTAATGGVLLGAFVVFQALVTPPAIQAKATPKLAAETTGSAPTADKVASPDCERQTWPYLSRACLEEARTKIRGPRLVSIEKRDQATDAALETSSPITAPSTATVSIPDTQAAEPAPAAVAVRRPATVPSADAAPTPALPAVKTEPRDKRVAKKAARNPKAGTVKQDLDRDNEDVETLASAESNARADRHTDGSRRIVERWIESDYDVPAANGKGRRRITVIRPSRGGVFENLFGMGTGFSGD